MKFASLGIREHSPIHILIVLSGSKSNYLEPPSIHVTLPETPQSLFANAQLCEYPLRTKVKLLFKNSQCPPLQNRFGQYAQESSRALKETMSCVSSVFIHQSDFLFVF